MANDLNRCEFIGRLGRSPEISSTPAGITVAKFSIACSEKYKDKDGKTVENTEWIRCVAWRQLADIIGKYLTKGSQIYVAGKWQTRAWDDKDGVKRYSTEVVIKDMQMLGGKGGDGSSSSGHAPAQEAPPEPDNEDVPF